MGGYTGEMLQKLRSPAQGQRSGFGVEMKQRVFGGIGLCVTVGFAYFIAAQLGLALRTAEEQVAVFWPASGIAIGVLVALGRRAFIPVAVAVMAASVATALLGDRYLWRALAFGFCNAVEALMAMWLIERWFGAAFNLDSLHRVVGFFAAVTVATATAAVGAAAAMTFFGPASASFQDVWEVWFASDALGTITVAPLLIGIAAAARDPPPWRELLEGTLAVVVVTATIAILLAILVGPWSLIGPSALIFPLLLWLGYRCRPVFAAAAVFAIAAAIVWTTTHELGRYGDPAQPIAIRVLAAQVVMLGTTLAALALAALFCERRRHEEHLRTLIAELDHRVKNVLATASALTSRTQDASSSVSDFVSALDGRIQSMAATHQLLSSHKWSGILLSDLVGRELAPYTSRGNTEIDGPKVTLSAEAGQAVSMVLHELATNAVKHGALSTHGGRIFVRWFLNGDANAWLRIEWQEFGGPVVQIPDRPSYGMEVIRDLLPYELDGKVDIVFAAAGVRWRVDIPISQVMSVAA